MCSCCNATYYGETKRHLFVRASEHLGITPLTQKRVKNPKKSAIIDHILSFVIYNHYNIIVNYLVFYVKHFDRSNLL